MRNMFMESGFVSLNKHGESICGDFHTMVKNRDNTTVVLSDGLGSGVKANILSTLTAKILSTMMDNNMPIEDCIYTMADTLPVCKVRNLAYATFTILQVNNYDEAYLVQFDNPPAIMLRNGKNFDYDSTRKTICGKEIYESHIKLQTDDTIVLMSDGVTSAGLGKTNQSGWDRNNIISFLEDWSASDMSPQRMAATLADACVDLSLGSTDDDITVMVFRMRQRQAVNIIIGPPERKEDDAKVLKLFFSKEGKHVVCGGSTAKIVGSYLRKPVLQTKDAGSPDVPATAHIDGVDLVTEGIVTLKKVSELASQYTSNASMSLDIKDRTDGASMITKLLFEEATDINFFVGQAVNPAHQSSGVDINFTAKMGIIKDLEEQLLKMGKHVKVSLC